MKPISISFRCFGPYINKQEIYFDRLAEQGLFLICGETGSGKTTILDAMCCALYGSCSGELRGDFTNMRCKQANPEDETEVEFIFENAGKRYRFERKLIRKREKGEYKFEEKGECQVESDGKWIPLLDNWTKTRMNKKAEELIGFSLEQFRQVIILPQGRFETFLTSNSADKEAILSTIFHTERWAKAVEKMNEDLKLRGAEIKKEKQTKQDILNRWELSAIEELPEAVKKADQEATEAIRTEEKAKTDLAQAKAQQELNKEYIQLDERQKNFDNAKKTVEEDYELQEQLKNAEKAEKARIPHDEWKQAKGKLEEAEQQLKETEKKLVTAAAALNQAEKDQKAHEEQKPGQEERETEIKRLLALRTRYEHIEQLRKTAADAKKVLNKEKSKKEFAEKARKAEKDKLQELEKAWSDAIEATSQISKAYQALAAGRLARDLQEGKKCPVCGNTHHPEPAELPEGSIDTKDVEEAENKQVEARKVYDEQKIQTDGAIQAAQDADGAYQRAEEKYKSEETALRQEMNQLDPGLKTLKELDQHMQDLDNGVKDYNEKEKLLQKTYYQANERVKALNDEIVQNKEHMGEVKKVYEKKELAWKTALKDSGLETEAQYDEMILSADEQRKMQAVISGHVKTLEEAKRELDEQLKKTDGQERPNSETVEQLYKEADDKYKAAIKTATIAGKKKEDLDKDAITLTKLEQKINEKNRRYEEDSLFVSALQGSNGLSIQRYVLSIRLGQVIIEANSLLSGIYGGRYQLHRSDESYGNERKNGLELEVYDSMSDQRRSVRTLSGGEKFLVALSLAIGLCTVVQNEQRGVNLEAMFIDEGFGSLDQSALGDALDILQSVQRGRGMVGIISHVAMLEETIPTKVVIRKTDHGSMLEVQK